jgi:hypothetical protein
MYLSNQDMQNTRDLCSALKTPAPPVVPVFTKTCFTGQPETDSEEVECPVCKGLVHTRTNAWYDPYNQSFNPNGCYVHYRCLSARRLAEISAADGQSFGE